MVGAETPYVVPLGIAAALPDLEHANSFLAVVRNGRYWLVDCADSPIGRLQRAGIEPAAVQGVIITHFHPDHVYGLPAYLLGLFLLDMERGQARETPVPIYARPEVLSEVRDLVALFQNQGWTKYLPLVFREVMSVEGAPVAEDGDFVITAAPSDHTIPSMALRFVRPDIGRAFVYSGDTRPCPTVERLAQGAALLFHEATDSDQGHTTPSAAGALAARAAVERLVLIHYRTASDAMAFALNEAQKAFGGPVELAQEFKTYPW